MRRGRRERRDGLVPWVARMSRLCALFSWILAWSVASSALAQETGHEPPADAMVLFESAREHYRAGRYEEAAEELERALVLDPSAPTLLFNLGRVYGLARRAISSD